MPFYDYLYGTLDASTDRLHDRALRRRSGGAREEEEETVDVVHLTHLAAPESIFHLRLGFASLASAPLAATATTTTTTARLRAAALDALARPLVALVTSLLGTTTALRAETNRLGKLNVETWVVPRYTSQYMTKGGACAVGRFIERSVSDAQARGARVLTLGLMNQVGIVCNNGGRTIILITIHWLLPCKLDSSPPNKP
jgi:aldehyde decarbonylase